MMSKLEFQTTLQAILLKFGGWEDQRLYQELDFVNPRYIRFALKIYKEMEEFE